MGESCNSLEDVVQCVQDIKVSQLSVILWRLVVKVEIVVLVDDWEQLFLQRCERV
jgi:hypothetical protein